MNHHELGLKILSFQKWGVPVQVWPGALFLPKLNSNLRANPCLPRVSTEVACRLPLENYRFCHRTRAAQRSGIGGNARRAGHKTDTKTQIKTSKNTSLVSGGTMAKRFTDTDKWKHSWLRGLKPHAKLVFLYLCDQCDFSGIWIEDFGLLNFQLGIKADESDFKSWFGSKIYKFDSDKWFISSFFQFQYGEAKESFRAKQAAIAKLQKLGLMDSNLTVRGHSTSVNDTPSIVECIVLDSFEEGVGETFDFEPCFEKYPNKKGKAEGMKRLKERGFSPKDFTDFDKACEAYRKECVFQRTDPKYIKHFSSFVGTKDKEPWRDYIPQEPIAKPPSLTVVESNPYAEDVPELSDEERRANAQRLREILKQTGINKGGEPA